MNRWRLFFGGAGAFAAGLLLAFGAWAYSFGSAPLGKGLEYSHVVLDREGRLLRAYATDDGRWRLPATEQDVDPRFLTLLFTYEATRFSTHYGVDQLYL